MGKTKKEHRKKVAKRNARIAQAKQSFQKKMTVLRQSIIENMMKQNAEQANTEDTVSEVVDVSESEVIETSNPE